jgi:hypothetical protein
MLRRQARVNRSGAMRSVTRLDLITVRRGVVVGACLWWLALALVSRFELSLLQLEWDQRTSGVIFVFLPLCIAAGLLAVQRPRGGSSRAMVEPELTAVYGLFWFFVLLFAVQVVIYKPPALSVDPNEARLEWGFKYVHVITEITIRTAVLLCVGQAMSRGGFTARDRTILGVALAYTVMVVSRSFMLEVLFYWALGAYINSKVRGEKHPIGVKHIAAFAMIFLVFVLYGNWRQGSDFSIVEYGDLVIDSNALAWVFGYFLVNFDNLALIMMEGYSNQARSNAFGSLMQTLQLGTFDKVDDYLYVGKFNLGTALRPFVLDFGPWAGGIAFALLWMGFVASPALCRSAGTRLAATALVAYAAFCLPITGRIEQPPYLFALIWILLIDRFAHRPARRRVAVVKPPASPAST